VPELQGRIIAVFSEIARDVLQRLWAEMGYQIDFCRITNGGAHEALLRYAKKKLEIFLRIV
jgi:hypothetical protein